ncbi:MAG: SEL1-like repeat protein, partial [Pseudomonadota bacterium]|nr:SEL1-like repeat protein [Pseudomonadota bacterium]
MLCKRIVLSLGLFFVCAQSHAGDANRAFAAAQGGDFDTALIEWAPLAEQGFARAQYNVGVMHEMGEGVPKYYKTAVKWYTLAAEQGYIFAQYNLALKFFKGEGVAKDPDAAVKWYTLAAEQGHVKSQYNLAVMYDTGDGIPEDNAAALTWYTQAAERGHIKAQYNLGLKFDNGTNVLEDDEAAFGWFKLAAEQADGRAEYQLGSMYERGEGVAQSYPAAIRWYTRAAEKGIASAQFNLGLKYDIGRGTPENDELAGDWYTRAAEQGHVKSEYNLSVLDEDTDASVREDDRFAEEWRELEAEEKYKNVALKPDFQALVIRQGRASGRDTVQWYAIKREEEDSFLKLALAGKYVERSLILGKNTTPEAWFTPTAERGSSNAQFSLALVYDLGEEVAEDDETAARWYARAAQQ